MYELETSDIPLCRPAITDGAGRWIGIGTGIHWTGYKFVPASGQGELTGSLNLALHGGTEGWPIAPQPSGYHAIDGPFLAYDEQGNLLAEMGGTLADPRFFYRIVPYPNGGSAIYSRMFAPADRTLELRLEIIDVEGKPRASVLLDRSPSQLAVTFSGNVLVLGSGEARWFGGDGTPRTEWFAVGETTARYGVPTLLADGSIAIHDSRCDALVPQPICHWWLAVVSDGEPRESPPPAWLSARPAKVQLVRGGRADAFITFTPWPSLIGELETRPCQASIEIVAPSGKSCGTLTLPVTDTCTHVDAGKDGTVFMTSSINLGNGSQRCVWRWWSGLLR